MKMQAFEISEIEQDRRKLQKSYLEFFRENSLSVGLYVLRAGEGDSQQPHTEDEVYYVMGGKGQIDVAGENRPISQGSVVFVPANVKHQFHRVTEDLSLLVFFAPSEYANALKSETA